MRIGLDAMGGDRGVAEVVAGAVEAQGCLKNDDRIVLFGDAQAIEQELSKYDDLPHIEVHGTTQVVGMAEAPVEAVRTKPDSSLVVMTRMQRKGEIDACVSAGNTGACVAAAQMHLRRLKGVHRPGIMVVVPTFHGPVALCDVGANVNCRPHHLLQYALMCSEYLKGTFHLKDPRVGLISVGEEETKGNDLVKVTNELMRKDDKINFIGNVEGRDLLKGVCDVMVCEGFVGNVILKLIEGIAEGLIKGLLQKFEEAMPDQLGRLLITLGGLAEDFDSNNYGGAPLLGVDGIFMICHGASNAKGIMNAICRAKEFGTEHVNDHIVKLIAEDVTANEYFKDHKND